MPPGLCATTPAWWCNWQGSFAASVGHISIQEPISWLAGRDCAAAGEAISSATAPSRNRCRTTFIPSDTAGL